MIRYTVAHKDTHERLTPSAGESLDKTLAILGTRTTARVEGQTVDFSLSEWYVTAWNTADVDAYGEWEIVGSVSADVFVDDHGKVPNV